MWSARKYSMEFSVFIGSIKLTFSEPYVLRRGYTFVDKLRKIYCHQISQWTQWQCSSSLSPYTFKYGIDVPDQSSLSLHLNILSVCAITEKCKRGVDIKNLMKVGILTVKGTIYLFCPNIWCVEMGSSELRKFAVLYSHLTLYSLRSEWVWKKGWQNRVVPHNCY